MSKAKAKSRGTIQGADGLMLPMNAAAEGSSPRNRGTVSSAKSASPKPKMKVRSRGTITTEGGARIPSPKPKSKAGVAPPLAGPPPVGGFVPATPGGVPTLPPEPKPYHKNIAATRRKTMDSKKTEDAGAAPIRSSDLPFGDKAKVRRTSRRR